MPCDSRLVDSATLDSSNSEYDQRERVGTLRFAHPTSLQA
jgi:hypothetical protein